MSRATPTDHFKEQRRKVKKNPCWYNTFHGEVLLLDDHRSLWEYAVNHFLNDEPIPDYFYGHSITLTTQQKSQIKNRLGSLSQVEIKGLDLHFDGHNGNHLLLYIWTNQGIVYLVGIGAHPDLSQLYLERSSAHDVSKKRRSSARTESQEAERPHSSRRYRI